MFDDLSDRQPGQGLQEDPELQLVQESDREFERQSARNLVQRAAVLLAVASAVAVALRWSMGGLQQNALVVTAVCIAVYLAVIVLSRFGLGTGLAGILVLANTLAVVWFGAAVVGGIDAPALVVLPLLPILGGHLGGTRPAAGILTATIVTTASVQLFLSPGLAALFDFPVAYEQDLGLPRVLMLSVAVVLSGLFAWLRQRQVVTLGRDLARRQVFYRVLFESSKDIVAVTRVDGGFVDMNAAGRAFFGLEASDLSTVRIEEDLYADPERRHELLRRLRKDGYVKDFESRLHVCGRKTLVSGTSTLVRDSKGRPELILTILRDISQQRNREAELEREARTDPLTGLANRKAFKERLESELARVSRLGGHIALLMIDLDRFKEVNDSHGHAVGDQVLADVARRLSSVIRGHDLLARFGGDELSVITVANRNLSEVLLLAERLREQLEEPFRVGEVSASVGASIGVAVHSSGEATKELIERADRALYLAKSSGGNSVEVG